MIIWDCVGMGELIEPVSIGVACGLEDPVDVEDIVG